MTPKLKRAIKKKVTQERELQKDKRQNKKNNLVKKH